MNYPIWRNTTFYFDNLDKRFDVLGIFDINKKYEIALVLNRHTNTISACVSDGWTTTWATYRNNRRVEWEDFCTLPKYVQKEVSKAQKMFN